LAQAILAQAPRFNSAERVHAGALAVSDMGIGLKTSGKELSRLLERSGAKHNIQGVEKLDLLVWLADQVTASIEGSKRMRLEIQELEALLSQEDVEPQGTGGKGAVEGLLVLRRREIARLGYGTEKAKHFEDVDAKFETRLQQMKEDDVDSCFALEPRTEKEFPDSDSDSAPKARRPADQVDIYQN